jgi:hypothetical protein
VKLEVRPSAVPRSSTADTGAGSAGADSADAAPEALPAPAPPFPAATPARLSETLAPGDPELRIARLEGKVAALEAALERRSGELRLLQALLCQRDLAQWTRQLAGLPPLPRIAHEPSFWHETRELTIAEVQETLLDLWSSLYPAAMLAAPRATGLAVHAANPVNPVNPAHPAAHLSHTADVFPAAAPASAAVHPDRAPDRALSASPPRPRTPPQ